MNKKLGIYTVEQLLELEGREFIINSYLAILGRNPDPDGYANYIRLLKAGASMRSILRALGTAPNERINMIPGLADLINTKEKKKLLNPFSRKTRNKRNIANASEILDVNFDMNDLREDQSINTQTIIESINNLSKTIEVNQQHTDMLITSHIDSLEQIALSNLATGRGWQKIDRESANSLNDDGNIQAREKVLDVCIRMKENIICTAGAYKYVAENDDPQLIVKTNGVFVRGWYRIDVLIDSSEPIGIVTVFPSYLGEGGAGHDTSVQWPYKSGKMSTYILYLDNLAGFLRVDPASRRIAFNITHISIKKISKDSVAESMMVSLDALSALFITSGDDMPSADELVNDYRLAYSKYLSVFRKATNYINDNLPYLIWMQNNEPLWRKKMITFANAEKNSAALQQFKISIVVPVFNPKIEFLVAAIESVIAQSYENWELVLADDASTNPAVNDLLNEYQDREPRIKVVFRKENGHISKATNSALELATGTYIAFMDHDDILDGNALAAVVQSLYKHPDAALIYSDEDKIDEVGNRFFPHFKTDWNPDLLLEHNYITHFCVVKACLVSKELYFDSECNGAQDYDFLLRIAPYLNQSNVIHIPWILYHWRAHKESTAFSAKAKTYSNSAGMLALEKFCKKNGIIGNVISLGNNYFRIKRDVLNNVLLSIIIPTKDKANLLSSCIESIYNKTTYRNFEIIIVDNNSREQETFDYFKACAKLYNDVNIFHWHDDFNWSAINNFAVQQAKGDILLFLNNDIEVISPAWLEEMVSHVQRPEVGCVGAKLLYKDMTVQHAGIILGLGGIAGHPHRHLHYLSPGYFSRPLVSQNVSAVTGACLMVRRAVFDQVGQFDERFPIAYNDVDFCLKVRAYGYYNVFTPYSLLFHHESASRGYDDTPEKQFRLRSEQDTIIQKWGEAIMVDPYYSPNLSPHREDFAIHTEW